MEDEKIVELFFQRSDQAIHELDIKYGKVVVMINNDYKETTGLWQIIGYQILDSETANNMIANKK